MSSEIATWGMTWAKVPAFPVPTADQENECLTKSEILNIGGIKVNGSYGDNESPMIEDIVEVRAQIGANFATSGVSCRIALFDRESWWGGMVPENIVEYVEIEGGYSDSGLQQVGTLKNVFKGNYFIGIAPMQYDFLSGDNAILFNFLDEYEVPINITSFTVANEYSECISADTYVYDDPIKTNSSIWINNSSDYWGGIKVAIAEVVLENGKRIEIRVCADRQF